MKKRNILIVVIVIMAVGFAVVTTNLVINGSVVIGSKTSDYDIIFSKAVLDGVEDNRVIIDDGKKISYETKLLKDVGESSELVYEITNNSSHYDGEISITCTPKGEITHSELYAIDTTNTPGVVSAKRSATGSIVISLSKETTEDVKAEFECQLKIDAVERSTIGEKEDYKERLLNGADPVVSGELIPVVLSNDGTVRYADKKEEWYSYENKNWANAVILNSSAKEYKVNDTIDENDIESYFVWIPKYKYKLWNVEATTNVAKTAHSIEVEFGVENTTDVEGKSCVTPMNSNGSGNCNNGEYMTHPAFISMGVNGIWVGKFETGYNGAQSVGDAQQNNANTENIIVKPNVYSWRNIQVSNIFDVSYNYKRSLDSHMMKNTEWGAVAYLSHSKYGIDREININNNSSFKTGYSANPSTNQQTYPGTYGEGEAYNQAYNTEVGYLASTTGNISGIYDISGGAWEYVSAYITSNPGASGLTTSNYDSKYFDTYLNSDITSYGNRILGDGTGEIGPFSNYRDGDGASRWHNGWYGDSSDFVYSTSPWFLRGGSYDHGVLAGQFDFGRYTGGPYSYGGFRLVLALT